MRIKKSLWTAFGLLAAAFVFGALMVVFAPKAPAKTTLGSDSRGESAKLPVAPVAFGPEGPKEVSLIRHAEEPNGGPDLSEEGRARANALVAVFQHPITLPNAIFAAKSSKQSARPVQTCEPLSKAVGIDINSKFDEKDFHELAATILQDTRPAGALVVVCRKRETMPQLAAALGVPNPPAEWPNAQYDHIWRITYSNGKATLKDEVQDIKLPGSPGAVK